MVSPFKRAFILVPMQTPKKVIDNASKFVVSHEFWLDKKFKVNNRRNKISKRRVKRKTLLFMVVCQMEPILTSLSFYGWWFHRQSELLLNNSSSHRSRDWFKQLWVIRRVVNYLKDDIEWHRVFNGARLFELLSLIVWKNKKIKCIKI